MHWCLSLIQTEKFIFTFVAFVSWNLQRIVNDEELSHIMCFELQKSWQLMLQLHSFLVSIYLSLHSEPDPILLGAVHVFIQRIQSVVKTVRENNVTLNATNFLFDTKTLSELGAELKK